MQVKQVMTQPAVTCSVNATLEAVARCMWECDLGAIPLVDDTGRIAGVVTDRDICMAAYTQGRPLKEIPAATAMAKEVFSCQPEETTESAEWLMAQKQIRRLPVVDRDGHPVGVVSVADLARTAARVQGNGAEHEVVETLVAIGEPNDPAARQRTPQPRRANA
jgi:CBS domain-containing protein